MANSIFTIGLTMERTPLVGLILSVLSPMSISLLTRILGMNTGLKRLGSLIGSFAIKGRPQRILSAPGFQPTSAFGFPMPLILWPIVLGYSTPARMLGIPQDYRP